MTVMQITLIILTCFGSYLLGSIPFTVWIGKLATGKDLRAFHSGNPGGFNAVRTYGFNLGILLLFLDQLKGCLTIGIVDHLFSLPFFSAADGFNYYHTIVCILAPAFCILGQIYPIWLKFDGGQGMGAYMGALMYVNPLLLLTFFLFHTIFYVGCKLSTRTAGTIAIILTIFPPFFIPIAPPWNNLLLDWTIGSNNFIHLTQGLIVMAMVLVLLIRRLQNALIGTHIKQETFLKEDR